MTLKSCNFVGNRAQDGAGVNVEHGDLHVEGSTFEGNVATRSGGGALIRRRAMITNSTFAGNSAIAGGGIYVGGPLLHFTDQAADNELTLSNSTVSGNSAKQGGGLYNGERGTIHLSSTIVAGNLNGTQANDIAGVRPVDRLASLNNLIGTGGSGGLVTGVQGNLVGVSPLLAPLRDYGGRVKTMALLPGSPSNQRGTRQRRRCPWGDTDRSS